MLCTISKKTQFIVANIQEFLFSIPVRWQLVGEI